MGFTSSLCEFNRKWEWRTVVGHDREFYGVFLAGSELIVVCRLKREILSAGRSSCLLMLLEVMTQERDGTVDRTLTFSN